MDGQVIRCGNCGQANRVPEIGGGKRAVCGQCKPPMGAASGGRPIVLTDCSFDGAVPRPQMEAVIGRHLGQGS